MRKTRQSCIDQGTLYTDQYQLTMAQLYYRQGMHEIPARFEHFFRSCPQYNSHKAGFCINAGLAGFLEWLENACWHEEELEALRGQVGSQGHRLFSEDFLQWLKNNPPKERVSIWAVPEGRVVHPLAPLTVVEGPLSLVQLLETPLLNHLNYPILVATKAARLRECSQDQPILEFGLRRAQEKGANAGARAALIGGADFTSNVGLSHTVGYPPKGTHAHSMIQAFMVQGGGELAAFRAYAETYPDDCLLLVDTINTLESGIPNAIKVFEELRAKGHEPRGIRMDSGDLAYLSVQAAKMLDHAGFPRTSIVLSGDLDELAITQIMEQIRQEAPAYGVDAGQVIPRLVFGVGTRLITSHGAPSLDGIFKLASLNLDNKWEPAVKLSESPGKRLTPGSKNVWRITDLRGKATADLLTCHDETPDTSETQLLRHPTDPEAYRRIRPDEIRKIEPLLEKVMDNGVRTEANLSIEDMRKRRKEDLQCLDPGVRRIIHPHIYHVSLSQKLWSLKQELTETTEAEST